MKNLFLLTVCSFFASIVLTPDQAIADQIKISGSVQFWQRTCSAEYRCGIPAAVGDRIAISEMIESPAPGTSLSNKTTTFSSGEFSGQLAVFWKRSDAESFLSGQSLLTRDGTRIAECSQYSTDQIPAFIPVGFCAGYSEIDGSITQYGMTYYK